jgi:hypothetical protein
MLADKAWTDMAKTRAMSAVAHKAIAPFLFALAALRFAGSQPYPGDRP